MLVESRVFLRKCLLLLEQSHSLECCDEADFVSRFSHTHTHKSKSKRRFHPSQNPFDPTIPFLVSLESGKPTGAAPNEVETLGREFRVISNKPLAGWSLWSIQAAKTCLLLPDKVQAKGPLRG